MKSTRSFFVAMAVVLAAVVLCLSQDAKTSQAETDHDGREHLGEGRREQDRKSGEKSEESGTQLALNQTYDQVRNGARLVLAYDAKSNSFIGTVANTTKKTLKKVRVEVHLSNGKELGPTTPADLAPGQKYEVRLAATSKDFDKWNAHPEVGSGEPGHGTAKRGERGREGNAEHH